MPPRRRRSTGQKLTPEIRSALAGGSLASMVYTFGSKAAARETWERFRDQIGINPWSRPAAWWVFEPGIPTRLREVPDLTLTPAELAEVDVDPLVLRYRKLRQFQEARRAWLAERFGE